MADEPFVDAHVHFFDHDVEGLRWRWLEPGFEHPRLKDVHRLDAPRFTAAELRAEAAGAGLAQVIHVQSASVDTGDVPERETAWLATMAAGDPGGWPARVVGWCRLRDPDAADVLARHAAHAIAVGVRDMSVTGAFAPEEVDAALAAAGRLGFSVELLVAHPAHAAVAEVAARHPGVTIVLGHAGQPVARDDAYRAEWLASLHRLARRPNVVVKVSALASGADPSWTSTSLTPWVLGCIEAFGPSRSMLASNWPIDRLHGTYVGLVDAYRTIVAGLSPGERAAVLSGTAERVYRA